MTGDEMRRATDRFERRMDERVTEICHHFDVTAEGMRQEIGLIADKLTRIDEKLDRRTADLEERMERGFKQRSVRRRGDAKHDAGATGAHHPGRNVVHTKDGTASR